MVDWFLASARRLLSCSSPAPSSLPGRLRNWHVKLDKVPLEPEEECAICLAQLIEQCVLTDCGHRFHMNCLENNFIVTSRATCPLCRRSLRGPKGISARALSGRPIEVLDAVPGRGAKCHFDRSYRFILLGDFVRHPRMLYVLTCNEDKRTPVSEVMWKLEAEVPMTVHLNFRSEHHVLGTGIATWLNECGWKRSTMRSTVSSGIPNGLYWGPVYSKSFKPGTIELMGSNCALGTYFVFIEMQAETVDS